MFKLDKLLIARVQSEASGANVHDVGVTVCIYNNSHRNLTSERSGMIKSMSIKEKKR